MRFGSRAAATDPIASRKPRCRLGGGGARKLYLGYSDAGFLHAGSTRRGSTSPGADAAGRLRDGGEAAVNRALDWLVRRDPSALEPELGGRRWRST